MIVRRNIKGWIGLIGGLGVVSAILVGGALLMRGPDSAYLPEMADQAIPLPDGRAIYAQRFEVTVAEWNICATQGGCALHLRARPDQDPATTPATGLSHLDVGDYVRWINRVARHPFRLPSAEEWQAMAEPVLPDKPAPLFSDPSLDWASAYLTENTTSRALRPQGSFSVTPQGVADLDGSVWEWTDDCYSGSYTVTDRDRCPAFMVGGEHMAAMFYLTRDPARGGCAVGSPPAHLGLRLVTDHPV